MATSKKQTASCRPVCRDRKMWFCRRVSDAETSSDVWTDSNRGFSNSQPSRRRAMALIKKARDFPLLAVAVSLAILIGSIPLSCGLILEPGRHGPVLTLNICHPMQSADRFVGAPYIPVPGLRHLFEPRPPGAKMACELHLQPTSRPPETPDPPPPRIALA